MFKEAKKKDAELTEPITGRFATDGVFRDHLFGTGAVAELERKIAAFYGMKYALCVSNATAGLMAIALALNLNGSDFVTSPYTYGGGLAGWLMLGMKPVFADIDPQTLTLDPEKANTVITSQTKALLAVDILGNPSDSDALSELSEESGIWYIADCAQSFGASRGGVSASHRADALVISFTVGKTLFAGEGGSVVTDNFELYEKLLWYSQHPYRQKRELGLGLSNEFAINCRIHPLAAVLANEQFEFALKELELYQEFCFQVIEVLNEGCLIEPFEYKSEKIRPAFFKLTVEPKENADGQEIERFLNDRGFRIAVDINPVSLVYQNPAFIEQYGSHFNRPVNCPIAESQAQKRITLTFLER